MNQTPLHNRKKKQNQDTEWEKQIFKLFYIHKSLLMFSNTLSFKNTFHLSYTLNKTRNYFKK